MAKTKIQLVDKERKDVAKVEIDTDVLYEAAILVYNGDHYLLSQVEGKFHLGFVFMQVNPPVRIG